MKKNTKNNKGFTLIEIIGVVIIIGIIVMVSGTVVTRYVANSREQTYKSYKADLKGAAENYLIDCMSHNEEGCEIGIPRYGIDEKITYNFLESKGYTEKLKDPEGDGYCDKSYVIAKNTSQTGVNVEYQVCLFCDNYESKEEGCKMEASSDTTAPECGDTTGESTVWSKENKVITVKCSDDGDGCKKELYSKSIGEEGKAITEGKITIEDKAGNKKTCPVKAYVDRKAPVCRLEVEEVKPSKIEGWSYPGVKVKLADTADEGSGVESYGIGTSLINRQYNGQDIYTVNNGIVTVFGYVKDKVGNEGYCSVEVKVDATNPDGTIYMGYEVYPKENAKTVGSTVTVNNISKYGQIEGVIVHFSEELGNNVTSSVYNEIGTKISTSGGLTAGKDNGIIRITSGNYDKLQIDVGSSNLAGKIEKIEVMKKESTTSVWTNKNISVYVDGKDTITGIEEYSYDDGSTYTKENSKVYDSNTTGVIIIKDKVGNESKKYSFTINKIDKEAPICGTINLNGTLGNNEWYVSNVTVTKTNGSDTLSGHLSTVIDKSSITKDTGGEVVTLTTTDTAGNTCTTTKEVKKDATDPSCGTINLDGTKGKNDWYVSAVAITKTDGSDKTSGHSETKINKTSITSDTTGETVTLTTTDNAGNTCIATKTVKKDETNPTCGKIKVSGTKGTNNWYTSNITITKEDGSDDTSGHAETTIDKNSITTDTSKSVITLVTTDGAGNSCTTTETVKKDSTKPECTLTSSGTKGDSDWYKSDVKISFSAYSDNKSEVSSYGIGSSTGEREVTLSTDTNSKTYTGYIVDSAGNSNTCTKTVKRDTTAPTLTVNAYKCSDPTSSSQCASTIGSEPVRTVNHTGNGLAMSTINWTNNGGYFAYTASDTNFKNVIWKYNDYGYKEETDLTHESEPNTLKSTYVTLTGEGFRKGTITVYDEAGNWTRVTVRIKIDRTPPILTSMSMGELTFTQWDKSENVLESKILSKPTCSGKTCTTGELCVVNKSGSFTIDVKPYPAKFSDNMSGINDDNYYSGSKMYDKDDNATGGSCLRTEGHNPCTWEWRYYAIDVAGNRSENAIIKYNVGYIGYDTDMGC